MNFREFLEYSDGYLYWKERPESAFKNKSYRERWNKRWAGKRAGNEVRRVESVTAYRCVCVQGKKYYEHRVIWEMLVGPIPEGMEIDHEDHDGLNNRIENLRITTTAGNSKNKPLMKNNTSGHIGVSGKDGKWRAYIGTGYRQTFLGMFSSREAAADARERASRLHEYHENHGASA